MLHAGHVLSWSGLRDVALLHLVPVAFAVGDVYALEHADDSFDVVHAHQVLQHLTDPVAALRELRRVARPGGVVAVRDADYAGMTWFPASPVLDEWSALYHEVTHPIVDWYAERGILVSVDAMRPADRVSRQILTALEVMRPFGSGLRKRNCRMLRPSWSK